MWCVASIDLVPLRFSLVFVAVLGCGLGLARGEESLSFPSGQFGFLESPDPAPVDMIFEPSWIPELGPATESDFEGGLSWPSGVGDHHPHAAHIHHGVGGKQGISRDPGKPEKPWHAKPGDINRGDCPPYRYGMLAPQRAGWPNRTRRFAQTSVTKRHAFGYVGGGAAFGGRQPRASEGVWGMDYRGRLPFRRIWLGWTDGKSQGGEGVYQTDGHVEPSLPGWFHDGE